MKKLICVLFALLLLLGLTLCVGAEGGTYIMDGAGLLEADEISYLEQEAQQIFEAYDFGVYVITVDDFRDFGQTDVFDAAVSLYEERGLADNGLLLLLSMAERDYSLITHGDFGNFTFNDDGRAAMTAFFLDDFADDEWFYGLFDYVDWAENYLEAAKNGTPYTAENLPVDPLDVIVDKGVNIFFALVGALIISGLVILILNAGMKSVAPAVHASAYKAGSLQLEKSLDTYLHTTTTRVKRTTTTSSGSSGSSGSRTSHSGGFSGTSGKF